MKRINWKTLIISIATSLGTGLVSTLLTRGGMREYSNLYKPPLSPPGWLFPIVWTILYLCMGIAAYLVYESGKIGEGILNVNTDTKFALLIYGIQLFLNALWPVLFFGKDAYFLAFAELLVLWFFVYLTWKQFSATNVTAGTLLLPYLVWVTFAGYLNLAIAIHYL